MKPSPVKQDSYVPHPLHPAPQSEAESFILFAHDSSVLLETFMNVCVFAMFCLLSICTQSERNMFKISCCYFTKM